MNFKAIIFDMDGTIVDTEKLWRKASHVLLERKGVALTPELVETLSACTAGLSLYESCRVIKELTFIDEPLIDLMDEKSRIAFSLYNDGLTFIPGFVEFHQTVADLNLKNGIATNATDKTIELTDHALNLRRFFGEHMYGISCVAEKGKPHPAIYTFVANKLGMKPEDCLAIEDSAHGIAAAKAAGMTCVGINTAQNRTALAQADMIVEHYKDINFL